MAMVLRSSISKVVRRAFSLQGNHSTHLPQLSRRGIYADRAANYTRQVDTSHASPLPASTEVDHLVQKVEDVAKKEVLLECAQSLVEEQKKEYGSLISEGTAYPWLLAMAMVGLFMAGYRLGVDQGRKQEFGKVKERN